MKIVALRCVCTICLSVLAVILAYFLNQGFQTGHLVSISDFLSSLPTLVKLIRARRILTEQLGGRLRGPPPASLELRPSDVWVITPPKSGTTWVTHIAHQLRVGGRVIDFIDQDDVVPWAEMLDTDFLNGTLLNRNPNGEHVANPRIFKSHLSFSDLPAGIYKKVFVFRQPSDALISAARFLPSLWGIREVISTTSLCSAFLANGDASSMLRNLVDVWKARHRDDVLLLFYEDIKEDPSAVVRRLARFMGVLADESLVQIVVNQTSHNAMVAKRSAFANRAQAINMHRAQGLALNLDEVVGKVRRDGGRVGDGLTHLPAGHLAAIQTAWHRYVTVQLGFSNYSMLRAQYRIELAVPSETLSLAAIDVRALLATRGDEQSKRQAGRLLAQAASEWGVARIVGHGIDVASIRHAGRRYFALPEGQRGSNFRNASVGFQRGYIPFAGESGLSEILEVKEGFIYGYEWPQDHILTVGNNSLQGFNVWPEDADGRLGGEWRTTLQSYYNDSVRLTRAILEGLELEIGKNGSRADDATSAGKRVAELCDGGERISLMRFFNYFPASYRPEVFPEKQRLGSSPHTDWYLITIILRDNVSRLQVASKAGGPSSSRKEDLTWWDLPAGLDGELLVLFGDYLSLYTGSRSHSPIHRVLLPDSDSSFSSVFLLSPRYDAPMPHPVRSSVEFTQTHCFSGSQRVNTLLDHADSSVWGKPFGEYVLRKRMQVMKNKR